MKSTKLVNREKRRDELIYSHFLALDKEKQQRILNAAYREFGRYGYKKTSIEKIAGSAGIAKGMIFYYFQNKLGLYEYLFENAYNFLNGWWGGLDKGLKTADYIEQYRYVTKIKLKAYTENPQIFEFFTMLYSDRENIGVSYKISSVYNEIIKIKDTAMEMMSESKNTMKFRYDIDIEKAKKYIGWLIGGYTSHLLADFKGKPLADMDLDIYWIEFDEILDDCKRLFYEPEK